jgi:hypothetical protein
LDELRDLARRLARWTSDFADAISTTRPVMPAGFYNRTADNWEPLFAIADVAGGEWPDRARAAAVKLALVDTPDDRSTRVSLLRDIRAAFDQHGERLPTRYLIAFLVSLEESAWAEWRAGKPLSSQQLARQLKQFGIVPRNLRIAEVVSKGYYRADFADAFARYL